MGLNKEPGHTHPKKFIDHNPLRVMRFKFLLRPFRQEAGNNSGDSYKGNEEKKGWI